MAASLRLAALLVATTCLGGCALFQPRPIMEDRYKLASEARDAPPQIGILVSTTETRPDASGAGGGGIAITSLSDRGQAALITSTNGKPPAQLRDRDGAEGPGVSRVEVHGTVRRSVVVAVRPKDFLPPGDRVDAIRVSIWVLPPQDQAWKITSWTQATNGTTSIDIGKVTEVSTSKFTAETGLKLAHALTDTKVGAEGGRTNTQELEIKDTSELSAAVGGDGRAWLDDVAGWRENLAHNLAIDVVISANAAHLAPSTFVTASALTKDDPKTAGKSVAADAGEVSLTELSIYGPDQPTQPICGRANLHYRVRHITDPKAAATFSESDDTVEFRTADSETDFVLAPPPLEPGYGLFVGKSEVVYDIRDGKHGGLRFRTLKEALDFGDWLNSAKPPAGTIGNATIGLLDRSLNLQPMTIPQLRQLLAGVLDVGQVHGSQQNALKGCPLS